jgi:ComF family protein
MCEAAVSNHQPLTSGIWRWCSRGLNLVFPPVCSYCDAPLELEHHARLCAGCLRLMRTPQAACSRCGSRLPATAPAEDCPQCHALKLRFRGVTRLGSYEGPLRLAVLRIKRPHERALAVALGDLLADVVAAQTNPLELDVVVPIPMHWTRRARRGSNSAESIAARLAERMHLPLASDLLARRRRTAPQANLSPGRRRANVRGAFRARPHKDLIGAKVLLVDDILTTGATLNEASKTLLKAGAAEIWTAVLARAEGLV